ncbi:aminotransferase class I/II-fold pyridoxal phosphate-dependent enzyme [Propionibacteriaceae bacterium Y1700]|uniref:aminotransferase class I/II-fold pyridoxal phosphate-dependent enzyme n=1 Tax=Microlunatus sp. Y1700 TaxID=3418487 RepID=UPI003DA76927
MSADIGTLGMKLTGRHTHTEGAVLPNPRADQLDRIYMSAPDITETEIDAVLGALRSGWVAPLGPDVDGFEADLAHREGRQHCVALSSGTAALHLGLLALGVRPGDVVVTATMTFAATTNAILYVGAEPVFVDCDLDGSINTDLLRQAVETHLAKGRRVGAILPVDLLGKVVDHASIAAISQEFGIPVLSDAAESLGAVRDGKPSASFGAAAAVSFNGNKIMTTSGGGALLTDDGDLAAHVRYLATQARQPVPHYEHTEVGYNYRLSNILAALGRAQLRRLDTMISRRQAWRHHYRQVFDGIRGVELFGQPDEGPDFRDNYWLTAVLIDPETARWTRDDLMGAFTEATIEARPLWKPMHQQPVHQGREALVDGTSDRLFAQGLTLPSGSVLTQMDMDRIDRVIERFCA